MKKNNDNLRFKLILISLRIVVIVGLTLALEPTRIIAGSPGFGRYGASLILALLLTAVFAEKYLVKLAIKLGK